MKILTTIMINELHDKLLELKDYFDTNSDLLKKDIKAQSFYQKWILDKNIEAYRGQKPSNLFNPIEMREAKSDLGKLKI